MEQGSRLDSTTVSARQDTTGNDIRDAARDAAITGMLTEPSVTARPGTASAEPNTVDEIKEATAGARVVAPPGGAPLDAALLNDFDGLNRIEAAIEAMLAVEPIDRELDDIPGFGALEEARDKAIDRIAKGQAESLIGLQVKAKAMLSPYVSEAICELSHQLGLSLARDVLGLGQRAIGPQSDAILAVIEESRRLDRLHDALLVALNGEPADHPRKPEQKAAHAASWRYWTETVLTTVPQTPDGCRALAAYAANWFKIQGGDEDDAATILGLIARSPNLVAGEPSTTRDAGVTLARRVVEYFGRASINSLPREAVALCDRAKAILAGEPISCSDLVDVLVNQVGRFSWWDRNPDNLSDEEGDAEMDRYARAFARAIEEPSGGPRELAAKAYLMIADLDRFYPEDKHRTDDFRLMRVILREAISMGGFTLPSAEASGAGSSRRRLVQVRSEKQISTQAAPHADIPASVEARLLALASSYEGFARARDNALAFETKMGDVLGMPLPHNESCAFDKALHYAQAGMEEAVRHAMALPATTLRAFGLQAQILEHDAGSVWEDDDIDLMRCRALLQGLIAAAGSSPIEHHRVSADEIRGWLADPATAPGAEPTWASAQ